MSLMDNNHSFEYLNSQQSLITSIKEKIHPVQHKVLKTKQDGISATTSCRNRLDKAPCHYELKHG